MLRPLFQSAEQTSIYSRLYTKLEMMELGQQNLKTFGFFKEKFVQNFWTTSLCWIGPHIKLEDENNACKREKQETLVKSTQDCNKLSKAI